MEPKKDPKIKIQVSKNEDLFDLNLCAKEFIDLIDNFKTKFLNKRFFILTAYYNNILVGLLVAEDKSHIVDSLEKILPIINIHMLYVNPSYRKKNIGKELLDTFLNIQKGKGTASIHIKLPQKYKSGIAFFLKNNFRQIHKDGSKVILEINLWNDYGIRDYQIVEEDLNDMLS
jgi:GNAT superfamily N-acetyltransferase